MLNTNPPPPSQGREGIWTALASAPLFAAKLPTGMVSGQLLQTLCPAPGACPAELGLANGTTAAKAAAAAVTATATGEICRHKPGNHIRQPVRSRMSWSDKILMRLLSDMIAM